MRNDTDGVGSDTDQNIDRIIDAVEKIKLYLHFKQKGSWIILILKINVGNKNNIRVMIR